MAGTFATWQPKYAARNLATFPAVVEGARKRPLVRGYLKIGAGYSRTLAARFPNASAFGFSLGPQSGLSVLDVDSSDERVLADALSRHGDTRIIVGTGRSHFQAWYRHGGERRMIRPDRSKPIDYLGAKSYVIAPPSRATAGEYRFLQGSLDDIGLLPVMRNVPDSARQRATAPTAALGERNSVLFRRCMAAAHHCDDLDALLDVARTENQGFTVPLDDDDVTRTAKSAWSYEQRGMNFVGSGQVVPTSHSEIDSLLRTDPDAYVLLTWLRRWHWGADSFHVANAMHETMPGGGWRRQRLAAARGALEAAGKIVCAQPVTRTTPALYVWPGGCPELPTNINTHLPSPASPSNKRGGDRWPA